MNEMRIREGFSIRLVYMYRWGTGHRRNGDTNGQ